MIHSKVEEVIMSHPSLLQFRFLPAEAKRAALQRLALRGCDFASILAQTGLNESEIRRHLAEPRLDRVHPDAYNTRFREFISADSGSAS
jgi:hypothetical protein